MQRQPSKLTKHTPNPSSSSSFSSWMNQQNNLEAGSTAPEEEGETTSLLSQLKGFNDGLATQLMDLSGSISDAAGFKQRLAYSIYCLLGSIFFAILAIFIGLPTLILKPSKFVLCITISTILAISSIVILQKPSVFIRSIFEAGIIRALPILCLFLSFIFTIYTAVFVHRFRYFAVIFAAGIQATCIMWYISSFIPGGQAGLLVLLRMSYMLVYTAMQPCLFVVKRSVNSFIAQLSA
jgi:Got1/Sft2-like family